MINLKENYKEKVLPKMKDSFGYKNDMAVPKIKKVVVNTGFANKTAGESSSERKKTANHATEILSKITGQKPAITQAKKSVSSFSLREGISAGAKVTLRGKRMYDFLEKVISIVLPRTRDFKGIPLESIDKNGNLTISFRDYGAFPEATPESEKEAFGLEATIVTTSKNKEEGTELLKLIGIPFKK